MQISSVPEGFYRIRQAGAKSDIANELSAGKKCLYVQIGIELTLFDNIELAQEFVEGKGLEADRMSMDFGVEKTPPVEDAEDAEDAAEA